MPDNNTKTVLVLSDLHCGSIFGMLPPKFKTSDDRIVGQNAGQKYLWNCWVWLIDYLKDMPLHAVVVNGDVVDGKQKAQEATELVLPIIEDQAHAAEQTLKFLKDGLSFHPQWYFTQGTEYHSGKAGREEEVVARNMGATPYLGAGTGRYCREVLDLEIDGVVCNFQHGASTSSGLYRATAPDREGIWSALAGKEHKLPRADVVVRGHVHHFVHVEHPSKHIVFCPCWELQTRFMRKHSAYRMLPDIGAVLLFVEPEVKRQGRDPITVKKILFDLPEVKTTKL